MRYAAELRDITHAYFCAAQSSVIFSRRAADAHAFVTPAECHYRRDAFFLSPLLICLFDATPAADVIFIDADDIVIRTPLLRFH